MSWPSMRWTLLALVCCGLLAGRCCGPPLHVGMERGAIFDSTLGFPGEGPECVVIGSANTTHWSSFLGAELWAGCGGVAPAAWCLQETKLARKADVTKAKGIADSKGWGALFGPAVVTDKLGISAGTGVLWQREVFGGAEAERRRCRDPGARPSQACSAALAALQVLFGFTTAAWNYCGDACGAVHG